MLQYILQKKKKIILVLLALVVAVACGFIGYSQYKGRPERVVRDYITALQQKQYARAYSQLLLTPGRLTSRENFVRQMQFWDYNSELDGESYLSGLKGGELQSLEVTALELPDKAQQAEAYSLANLQQEFSAQQKLKGVRPAWSFYAVQAVLLAEGQERRVRTTLAVQADTSFLGRLLARNYIVDPCISRTVLLEVEDNTKVELGGEELTHYQQTNYNTLIYRVEQLFPGRYAIRLSNPLADAYEGNLRLSAAAQASSRFNLCGRLQLLKKNSESIEAEERSKKAAFAERTAYVKGYDVFLKDRPSTSGQIVAVLQSGETLQVLDKRDCEDKQAAVVTDKLTVEFNGEKLRLEAWQPVKIVGEQEESFLCRLDLESSSGFVTVPKDKLRRLWGSSWYFVRTADGRQGWIFSELVNIK